MTELEQSCIDFAANPIAGGVIWKDATSYSQSDRKRIPTAFQANVNGIRVYITCGHVVYRPTWIVVCRELAIEQQRMPEATTAQEAADMAIKICTDRANELASAFNNLF
jgi:hypothetical protein